MFNSTKFKLWLTSTGLKKSFVADKLGCTRQSFQYKSQNGSFNMDEIATLMYLGLSPDDIFEICK